MLAILVGSSVVLMAVRLYLSARARGSRSVPSPVGRDVMPCVLNGFLSCSIASMPFERILRREEWVERSYGRREASQTDWNSCQVMLLR